MIGFSLCLFFSFTFGAIYASSHNKRSDWPRCTYRQLSRVSCKRKLVDINLFHAVFPSFEEKERCRCNRHPCKYGSNFISKKDYKLRIVVRKTWSFSFYVLQTIRIALYESVSLLGVSSRDRLPSFLIDRLHLSIGGESGQDRALRSHPFFYSSIDITWIIINACMSCVSVCLLGRWITFFCYLFTFYFDHFTYHYQWHSYGLIDYY